jgi:ABC-type dipeptide/oligopeptide/nickel transport system ATPase component
VEREAEHSFEFAQKERFTLVINLITFLLGQIRTVRGHTRKFGSFPVMMRSLTSFGSSAVWPVGALLCRGLCVGHRGLVAGATAVVDLGRRGLAGRFHPRTCGEHVEYDVGCRRGAEEALRAVGLQPEEILGRYPHQLSGGQRQRIMAALALLLRRPRLIVTDEPVSMVDASLRASIPGSLRKLHEELGISILYSEHLKPLPREHGGLAGPTLKLTTVKVDQYQGR